MVESDDDLEHPYFRVGTASEGVRVTVLGREHPDMGDYWDGNWLVTSVSIRSGAFSGKYTASLRADELAEFLNELRGLDPSTPGTAHFRSMENWLYLEVTVDHLGHVTVTGRARDHPGMGNTLEFELPEGDQTFLAPLIVQLERVVEEFFVMGSPDD